jgi:glutamate dehydrogenase/leucine dehydrogenase
VTEVQTALDVALEQLRIAAESARAFSDVHQMAKQEESDMRTGALMLGVGRVIKAMKTLGLWP